jgi:4-hydroxy-4-methyl-2-oxoglutarate aldolase
MPFKLGREQLQHVFPQGHDGRADVGFGGKPGGSVPNQRAGIRRGRQLLEGGVQADRLQVEHFDVIQPGDVVVVKADSFTETAVIGDLLLGMMKNNGAAAFVTDGLVRDTPGIIGVGIPTFSAGVTPNSPAKTGPGTVGLPVVVGGVAVDSGDIIVGDQDGVVVIPRTRIAQTLKNLEQVRKLEAAMEVKVKAGMKKSDIVDLILKPGTIKEVD